MYRPIALEMISRNPTTIPNITHDIEVVKY
jgi:hypothetical protein